MSLTIRPVRQSIVGNGIELDRFSLDELSRPDPGVASRLCATLQWFGAIIITDPQIEAAQRALIDEATAFFAADEPAKRAVEGHRAFSERFGDQIWRLGDADTGMAIRLADYLGGERGWISRSENAGARSKEYFQFGEMTRTRIKGIHGMKDNIWPKGDRWSDFRQACRRVLDCHRFVHQRVRLLGAAIFTPPGATPHGSHASEIICRVSHYPPAGAASAIPPSMGRLRNPGHVDLSDGTLVGYEEGLQLYAGRCRRRADILADEGGWKTLEGIGSGTSVYFVGLASEIQSRGNVEAVWHRVSSHRCTNAGASRRSIVSFWNDGLGDELAGGRNRRHGDRFYPCINRDMLPAIGNARYFDSVYGL